MHVNASESVKMHRVKHAAKRKWVNDRIEGEDWAEEVCFRAHAAALDPTTADSTIRKQPYWEMTGGNYDGIQRANVNVNDGTL